MFDNIKEMFSNTITFLGSGIGIFVLVLLGIVLVEFLVIWLLLWIIKNSIKKDKGVTQVAGTTQ